MRPAVGRTPPVSAGYTLLELIVVVLLLTILLGFAVPAFQDGGLTGARDRATRELLLAVKKLKIDALRRQSTYRLHLDLDAGRMWVTDEDQPSAEPSPARRATRSLPDGIRFGGVRFADKREVRSGTVAIGFYPQGYSDRALVRLVGDGPNDSVVAIEAFLPVALIVSGDAPPAF